MKAKSTLLIAIILVVPMFMMAQFTKEDQKAVKKYTKKMCTCTKELINTLDPTVIKYLRLYFDEGEAKAIEFLTNYTNNSQTEIAAVEASFKVMGEDNFMKKLSDCDNKEGLDKMVAWEIDNMSGEAYNYFLKLLEEENGCYWFKNFYKTGKRD